MNICLVCDSFPPEDGGGIGTYISNLSRALALKGNNVYVICKTMKKDMDENYTNGVTVIRRKPRYFPIVERLLPGIGWSLQVKKICDHLIKTKKVNVIEFPNWGAPGIVFQLLNRKFPCVVRVHTPFFETLKIDFNQPSLSQRLTCSMEKYSCKLAHSLVSSTKAHASTIAVEYDYELSDFQIIPLGIDVDKNVTQPLHTEHRYNLLYVSRLENRKGTLTLLRAIPKLVKVFPDLQVNIIGRDRPHAPNDTLFKEYFMSNFGEFESNVNFLGFVEDHELLAYYQEATAFVVPSIYESFGLIYIEAMQFGLPCIATSGGGIPEVISDGETGLLITPDDHEELVLKVTQILENPALRKRLSENSTRLFHQKFTSDVMALRTFKNYSSVVK
jgi:glycogen(starch) synthase